MVMQMSYYTKELDRLITLIQELQESVSRGVLDYGQVHQGPRTLHTKLQRFFFKKSLWKLLPIYKTVEKIVAVVRKSYGVNGR